MSQSYFRDDRYQEVPEEKRTEFAKLSKKIITELSLKVANRLTLNQLVDGAKAFERADNQRNEAPEDVTEKFVIEPLLEYLGYKDHPHKTGSGSAVSHQEADYTIDVNGRKMLIESEPINKDLYAPKVGVKQLSRYLENRSFQSDFGIATDGFRWILLKYNTEVHDIDILLDVDLKPLFQEVLGQRHIEHIDDILAKFYFGFSKSSILDTISSRVTSLREFKESTTRTFYEDYIRYIFGYDKGSDVRRYCLLDAITTHRTLSEQDKRLFAVTLMNRLIFIKFLEDKKLVEPNLLGELLKIYNRQEVKASSFYTTFLKSLFYDVLNTDPTTRKSHINDHPLFKRIPYLNGGLFREVIEGERDIDVDDSIVEKIIRELLEQYTFALRSNPEALDPDILGNVFEKTINYLTGMGTTERRKEMGAYYTGENITSFISKNTIHPYVLKKVQGVLREHKWKEGEIQAYHNLESFLDDLPKNKSTIQKILEEIDGIKVLDPACGSGHFLTSALKELVYIRRRLLEGMDEDVDLYFIKKAAISKNLYGVDIEVSAVEIAKLRLWLSLIEDLDTSNLSNIETLPNIEYNLLSGNSLVGWFDEVIKQTTALYIRNKSLPTIFSAVKVAYDKDPEKLRMLQEAQDLITAENGGGAIRLKQLKRAYSILREIYATEEGMRALYLRSVLEDVRVTIYEMIDRFMKFHITDGASKDPAKKMGGIEGLFHWNVDFGDVLDAGGFDIVIGNPPYGVKLRDWEVAYIDKTLPFTERYTVSELAFMEKSKKLVRDGGYVGMIVPKSLTYSQKWVVGRDLIGDELHVIVDVSKAFADVKLEQVVYILVKGRPVTEYRINDIEGKEESILDKSYTRETDNFILYPDKESLKLYVKLSSGARFLRSVSSTCRGFASQSEVVTTPTPYKVYRGKHISRFHLDDSNEYLEHRSIGERDKLQTLSQPKIMSQRIVAHITNPMERIEIMSFLDSEGRLSLDTVENTIVTDDKYSLEFITCLLNSTLASWYTHHYIFSDAIRTMDLDDYYIGKIPLPKKELDQSVFKTLIDQIAEYSTDVKHVRKKKGVRKSRGQVKGFDKLMEEVNDEIFKVYGLTPKEISLITGETKME